MKKFLLFILLSFSAHAADSLFSDTTREKWRIAATHYKNSGDLSTTNAVTKLFNNDLSNLCSSDEIRHKAINFLQKLEEKEKSYGKHGCPCPENILYNQLKSELNSPANGYIHERTDRLWKICTLNKMLASLKSDTAISDEEKVTYIGAFLVAYFKQVNKQPEGTNYADDSCSIM